MIWRYFLHLSVHVLQPLLESQSAHSCTLHPKLLCTSHSAVAIFLNEKLSISLPSQQGSNTPLQSEKPHSSRDQIITGRDAIRWRQAEEKQSHVKDYELLLWSSEGCLRSDAREEIEVGSEPHNFGWGCTAIQLRTRYRDPKAGMSTGVLNERTDGLSIELPTTPSIHGYNPHKKL